MPDLTPKAERPRWPLFVHAILFVWVCYVLALFLELPQFHHHILAHLVVVCIPPWYLGRAMLGAYAKKEK